MKDSSVSLREKRGLCLETQFQSERYQPLIYREKRASIRAKEGFNKKESKRGMAHIMKRETGRRLSKQGRPGGKGKGKRQPKTGLILIRYRKNKQMMGEETENSAPKMREALGRGL